MGSVIQVILCQGCALWLSVVINVTKHYDRHANPSLFFDILRNGLVYSKVRLDTTRSATYKESYFGLNESFLMTSCPMIRQNTDLIKYWSRFEGVEAEERVHICFTLGWTSAKYSEKFCLRLPMGVLPYIEVVDELLLPTQSHEKRPKNVYSRKLTNFAAAYNRYQTIETTSYT